MLFNCPECGQTLRAADEAAGKKCRCTSCQQLVPIPGGPAKAQPAQPGKPPALPAHPVGRAKPASPSKPQPPARPAPKPTVATELDDLIVRQQEQIYQQAAQYHQHREQAERRSQQIENNRKYYSSSQPSSASPLRIIFTFMFAIGGLLVLACCGFFGFAALGQSTLFSVKSYTASANAKHKVESKTMGTLSGQSGANALTGSEFWLLVDESPGVDYQAEIRGLAQTASSQQDVERGNLKGKRLTLNRARLLEKWEITARCEMELLVDGSKLIVMVYSSGSAKADAGVQPRSKWESIETSIDRPESFFASISRDKP